MKNLLLLYLILCFASSFAQNTITVSGKVLNEQKEGLEGVNIQLLNSNITTKSNAAGRYHLKLSGKFTELKISYSLTGFIKQVVYINRDKLLHISKDVVLISDVKQLDTVTISSQTDRQGNL